MKEKLTTEWIESLPKINGSFSKIQQDARNFLSEELLPQKSSEGWRLSNLSRLRDVFKLPINTTKNSIQIFLNSEDIVKADISNETIERINDDDVIKYLSDNNLINQSSNFLATLNNAINNNLIALKLKSKEIQSLEIVIPNSKKELSTSRVILIVEEGASLEILEVIKGSEFSAHSHLIDIFIEGDSTVNHGLLAVGESSSKLLTTISIRQKEKSNYSLTCFQEGWSLSRIEQYVNQLDGNASTQINGLQVSNNQNQLATHSLIRFDGPGGNLNQIQKSISDDQSHSIFSGSIEVPKIAQKTQASQLSKNLILSSQAKVDTSPQLKIVADDVKCNHGATISQLEKEEIFYLQSRGIDKKRANNLILNGFCKDILNLLPCNLEKWSYLSKYLNPIN